MGGLSDIDKHVKNLNKEVKQRNKKLKQVAVTGQIVGGVVLLVSVVDAIPDLVRETFTLMRNGSDILGLVGGAVIFFASRYYGKEVAENDEERRKIDLDIALTQRYPDLSHQPEEPFDRDSINPN